MVAVAGVGLNQEADRTAGFSAELLHELTPEESVRDVAFSRFGNFLATAGYYGRVTLYDREFNAVGTRPSPQQEAGRDPLWDTWLTPIAFSIDESHLFIGNYTRRGNIGVLDTQSLQEVGRFSVDDTRTIQDITVGPEGKLIAAATNERVTLWSRTEQDTTRHSAASSGAPRPSVTFEQVIGEALFRSAGTGGAPGFREVRFSPDGAMIAAELSAGYIVLYTMKPEPFTNTQYLPPIPEECRDTESDFKTAGGCIPGSVYGFRFSPDGQWLAVGSERDGLTVWRRSERDLFTQVHAANEPPFDAPGGIAFDGGSGTVFVGEDEAIRAWSIDGNRWHRLAALTPQGHHGRLALSPDGRYLVAGTAFSHLPEFSTQTELVEPALRVWRITGADMTHSARFVSIIGEDLSPIQKELFTPGRLARLLSDLPEQLSAPQGMFETDAEFSRRQARLRDRLKREVQGLTEQHVGAKVEVHGKDAATVRVPLSARGTYEIEAERYTLPVMGQTVELRLDRNRARTLYRGWEAAHVAARRVRDVTGYDYVDFRLVHPEIETPLPVPFEVNPFTGNRHDTAVKRSPVVPVGSAVELRDLRFSALFPALYRSYRDTPVGTVTVANVGEQTVSNLAIRTELQEVGAGSQTARLSRQLGIGRTEQLDLPTQVGKELLEYRDGATITVQLTVRYVVGDETVSETIDHPVRVLNRNAIRWDQDQKVAAFMSVNEPRLTRFATTAAAAAEDQHNPAMSRNLLYAMRLYEAIRTVGVAYVVDPSSAYEELSEDERAIDHVRFPAETLSFKAGDCDDLSVLFNSGLEALGVPTAFITTPGHIFAAFDLGVPRDRAQELYSRADDLIFREDRSWVPVETTLLAEGFMEAWRTGARQWRAAVEEGTAGFFTTADAWRSYKPAAVELNISEPTISRQEVRSAYQQELKRFRNRELSYHRARLPESPQSPTALTTLGMVYARYGFLEEALTRFERAAEGGPTLAALLNAAAVLSRLDRHEDALSYLARARDQYPEHPRVHLGLAVSHLEAGDTRSARSSYRRLSEISPRLAKRYPIFSAPGDGGRTRAADRDAAERYLAAGVMEP
jgi:tetratricopeptide (TPR) repeat protein/WD40 repeat protein